MSRTVRIRAAWAITALAGVAASQTPPLAPFLRQQLTDKYYAEGADTGDFNRDGHPDIVAGPFWWAGPEFRDRHTIYPPRAFPIGTYSINFPGVRLGGIPIPLNPAPYTTLTLNGNSTILWQFRGRLDANGRGRAEFRLPSSASAPPITLHHAALILPPSGAIQAATNPVPLRLF